LERHSPSGKACDSALARPALWSARKVRSMPQTGRDTHFGFRQVPLEDKQALVDDV
jgi:hypothetical protein